MIRQSGLKDWIARPCLLLLEWRPFELWLYFNVKCIFTILQKVYYTFLELDFRYHQGSASDFL